MHRYVLTLLCLMCCLQQPALAYTPTDTALLTPGPFQNWKTLETEHFRINYRQPHFAFAQRLAAVSELVYAKQTVVMQWQPTSKTEVVISDTFDGSNGGATVLPFNQFFIFMNAPVDGELLDNSPWIEQVFTHEFVHILHLDQGSGPQTVLRRIFGRFFLAFPQIFNPSWVTEGIAVYEETDFDKGFGRGQSAFYEAMMRAEQKKGFRSFSELSYQGYWGTDWPSGQVYLYGYYFYEFLVQNYGEAKAREFVRNWNDNVIPWQVQSRSREVFALTAEQIWDQYREWLRQKFSVQLERLPINESQPIVENGRVNSNPQWLPDGRFFYYRDDGHEQPVVQQISPDGTTEALAEIQKFIHMDAHPKAGVLISRYAICDNVKVYADLYRLLDNGDWQRVTKCGRYPRAAWSSGGDRIAAVHTELGLSQIVVLGAGGEMLNQFAPLNEGEVIGYLDWSPDDRSIVASVRRESTGWNLELLNLESGEWSPLTRNTYLEQQPQFSSDGNWLYFLSDHGGVINVRRLRLSGGKSGGKWDGYEGQVETVSRTQTAILGYSINADESRIRVAEYTAEGVAIREQDLAPWDDRYLAVDTQLDPVQSLANQSDFSSSTYTDVSNYSALDTIAPTSWFAFFYADSEDNGWLQLILQGRDVLGFHQWQVAPAWYYDKSDFGGSLMYTAFHRFSLLLNRELDTISEASPSNIGVWSEETRYQALWQQPFNRFEGTFELDLGVGNEDVKQVTKEWGELDSYSDNFAGISLNWNDYEYYLHSISPEDGRSVKAQVERYNPFGDGLHDGNLYSIDWREYIGLVGNQVLAMRAVFGRAEDGAKPFQLGNELDKLETLGGVVGFGRTGYTLRGYSDNQPELSGTNLRLFSVEYRLPIVEVFDGLTSVPVGLGKTAVHFFVDHGAAWSAHEDRDYYTGVGFELWPDLLIGYSSLKLNSSLGFAYGLDDDVGESSVYLRLGVDF